LTGWAGAQGQAGSDEPEEHASRTGEPGHLLAAYDAVLLDLDGVVYRGAEAVPGSVEAVGRLLAAGIRVAYATNNASRTPESVARHLVRLGIGATAADVVTSAQVAVATLAELVDAGSSILVVGGPGLHEAVTQQGFMPVSTLDEHPAAVVQGFGPDVGWRLLAQASYAASAGLPWVATNDDLTVPTDRGLAPGNGTFVAAVAAAAGRRPLVTGKPAPHLQYLAAQRVGAVRPLVVGDRLDTDVAGAVAAGMACALVLSGVSTRAEVDAAVAAGRAVPTWVADDLLALVQGDAERVGPG